MTTTTLDLADVTVGSRLDLDGRWVAVTAVDRADDLVTIVAGRVVVMAVGGVRVLPEGGATLIRLTDPTQDPPTDPGALDHDLGEPDGPRTLRTRDGARVWPVEVEFDVPLRALGLTTTPYVPPPRRRWWQRRRR